MSSEYTDEQWTVVSAPYIYRLLQPPDFCRRLRTADVSLPVLQRDEVVIAVEYTWKYTMHVGTPYARVFQLKCRSGPRIGITHDVQFNDKPWHGCWSYDETMEALTACFKYNYPLNENLKMVSVTRRDATTWKGWDQEARAIEMKLMCIRTYCTPSYRWTVHEFTS